MITPRHINFAGTLLGRHYEVLSHAPEWRAVSKTQTARYGSEVLIGSAHLAAGDREAARQCAQRALSAWRRVLSGLYDPSHKTAWLNRGTEVFELAIQALNEPTAGLDESLERRLLFEFCEQSKSRLIGDMLNRQEYVPGPYIMAAAEQRNAVVDLMDFAAREAPDWLPILAIHSVAEFSDGAMNVTWTPGASWPTRMERVELAALRTTLRVSVQEDQRLLATADAVSYDAGSFIQDEELIEQISKVIPGVGS